MTTIQLTRRNRAISLNAAIKSARRPFAALRSYAHTFNRLGDGATTVALAAPSGYAESVVAQTQALVQTGSGAAVRYLSDDERALRLAA